MNRFKSILLSTDVAFLITVVLFSCAAAATTVTDPRDFFFRAYLFFNGWGGLGQWLKAATTITLVVSTIKITPLNRLLWSPLGQYQTWVGPVVGLLAGFITQHANHEAIFVYVTAGMGSAYIHAILDMIKLIPGIGPMWVVLIDAVEAFLGGGTPVTVLKRRVQFAQNQLDKRMRRK